MVRKWHGLAGTASGTSGRGLGRFDLLIAVAVANVPCQTASEQECRSIVLERFSDFKALLTSAAPGPNDGKAERAKLVRTLS